MVKRAVESHDPRRLYCRMLGHEVPFKYCRNVTDNLPCRHVFSCWQGNFNVAEFIRAHYNPEEIERFTRPPKPKMAQIYELIEKARGNLKKKH